LLKGSTTAGTLSARLERLLRVLDVLEHGTGASREVAEKILSPRARFATPIEWMTSSERRQTLRLVRQAKALRDHGYLRLLSASRVYGR
jgi:hypothetical protein